MFGFVSQAQIYRFRNSASLNLCFGYVLSFHPFLVKFALSMKIYRTLITQFLAQVVSIPL